jgi:hypothetical protein
MQGQVIGTKGILDFREQKTQVLIWVMFAAPLFLSTEMSVKFNQHQVQVGHPSGYLIPASLDNNSRDKYEAPEDIEH